MPDSPSMLVECSVPVPPPCRRAGLAKACLAGLLLILMEVAAAAPSQLPLLSRDGLEGSPNVMFTLDDSGSMDWSYMPDDLDHTGSILFGMGAFSTGVDPAENTRTPYPRYQFVATDDGDLFTARFRSSAVNRIYYDPAVRFMPWSKADGTTMTDSSPAAARIDPMNAALGSADLTATATVNNVWCLSSGCALGTRDYYPATYFEMTGSDPMDVASFTRVRIAVDATSYDRPMTRTDCPVAGAGLEYRICTRAQELQNFANWFTYYRTRMYLVIASASQAFSTQDGGMRLGYGRINKGSSVVDGTSTNTIERGVREFTGADRTALFSWLHGRTGVGGTPLRRAMGDVGEYFRRSNNFGPWAELPGSGTTTKHLECRKSYNILMTDGYWNGEEAGNAAARDNIDNTAGPITPITGPDGQSWRYEPEAPYMDSASNTLADVAMYYWNRDLRPDLPNRVRPDPDNPAFWQQLVQFTVGLGVGGTLDPTTDLPALTTGSLAWPTPSENDATTIDDLWHAAVNSRGRFLSAGNPEEFELALTDILQRIAERESAEGGAAVSATTLDTPSVKFTPTYRTGRWSGDVVARNLDTSGVDTGIAWKASEKLPAPASRKIFMGVGGTATPVAFNWATMTGTQRLWLGMGGSSQLVAYLRGDRAKEGSGYRKRDSLSLLGDMVNSTPVLIGGLLDEQYNFLPSSAPGAATYRDFVAAKKARSRVMMIGANDGMVHAFRETDGVESFAFVPRALVGSLRKLAAPNYKHQFFVDGPLEEADAWFNDQWNNIVIGSLGAGGKSLFAINVTDTAALGAASVMWETTVGATGAPMHGLGYVFSPVQVGRLKDGRWAAFVGSGFESATGTADMLILDVATGALIKRLTTSGGTSNGLGGVRLVKDFENTVVAAYAGDLKGNLWRFDLSGVTPAEWVVGFGNKPLFVAKDGGGVRQPIQAQPEFVDHPEGGQLVIFGTGKLIEDSDLASSASQSLYGVWDRTPGRVASADGQQFGATDSLVVQTFGSSSTAGGVEFVNSSATAVDYSTRRGWRLNLTLATGLRAVDSPRLVRGYALFGVVAPNGSELACEVSSATGYNILVNALNGASPTHPVFDTNDDGKIDADDSKASTFATVADGNDTVQLGKNGVMVMQRALGQTEGRLAGRSLQRSWRQLLNYPR